MAQLFWPTGMRVAYNPFNMTTALFITWLMVAGVFMFGLAHAYRRPAHRRLALAHHARSGVRLQKPGSMDKLRLISTNALV